MRPCYADRATIIYFVLTFAISWAGAALVVGPTLLRHEPVSKLAGLLMFPAMLLGPGLSAVVLTVITEGRSGLSRLGARMTRARFPRRWYATLLIPPTFVLLVLYTLQLFVSPAFTPGRFVIGIAFGLLAGFAEEIGWTGYAFPRFHDRLGLFRGSALLGIIWGIWHLPVIDYLGAAAPHGAWWFRFVLAFVAAIAAVRILIGWAYAHTESVLLAQLLHASSTSSLAVFGPPRVTPAQEALWYAAYAAALWCAVAAIHAVSRNN